MLSSDTAAWGSVLALLGTGAFGAHDDRDDRRWFDSSLPRMWKKVLVLVAVVGAAAYVAKRVKAASEERALWHEATTAPDLR